MREGIMAEWVEKDKEREKGKRGQKRKRKKTRERSEKGLIKRKIKSHEIIKKRIRKTQKDQRGR